MNIVFDIGNVLLRWDPRFLFTQYFDDEAEMEWFLAHVCNHEWNLEQDRGRSFAEAVKLATAQHPDHAEAIAAYDTRWHETLPHAIEGTVAIFKELVEQRRAGLCDHQLEWRQVPRGQAALSVSL